MPLRVLQHGFAGTTPSVGLEPGRWSDVCLHGQFLMDLEFLMRYGPRSGTASCVYCKSPPYLLEISQQFPWIHFYVFEHQPPPSPEYDPTQPELAGCSAHLTVQVEYNRTTSRMEFTKDMARTMGERGERERESLLMICHGQDSVRQLVYHILMRPCYSFLDVCGTIPMDYLEGELMLPIYIPNNKVFVGLVASQHAKCMAYDSTTFVGEMGAFVSAARFHAGKQERLTLQKTGFFQGIIRATQAYDDASRDVITGEYARSTHGFHGCPEEIVKTALESTIDLLWAEPAPLEPQEDPNLQSTVELLQAISQLLPPQQA